MHRHRPRTTTVRVSQSRQKTVETSQTYAVPQRESSIRSLASSGCEIEAERDHTLVAIRRYRALVSKIPRPEHPILLRATPLLKASQAVAPPRKDTTSYEARKLISQALEIAVGRLPPGLETAKDLAEKTFAYRMHRAVRVSVISSPIYDVVYEYTPPPVIIEALALPSKIQVAQLLIQPVEPKKVRIFDQIWQPTQHAVSYGKHCAVPVIVGRDHKSRAFLVSALVQRARRVSVQSLMPKAPVQIKTLHRAPEIRRIQLATVETAVDARRITELYIDPGIDYYTVRSSMSYTEIDSLSITESTACTDVCR